MFDSHCHLNFKAFNDDALAVANAMLNNHVAGLVVGCDRQSSRYAIDLAQTFSNLWASVGLHPIHTDKEQWDDLTMKELALEDRVVAIGEVGMDFYHLPEKTSDRQRAIKVQEQVFIQAINLAQSLNKPLIVHSRQAYDEIINILKQQPLPQQPGTVHCFMGNRIQAQALLDLGFMIGFTGVITYDSVDPELLEVVKIVPKDRLLIETDSPYLTPEPYRTEGKQNSGHIPRNLPQYSLEVAKKIAQLTDQKMMAVVMQTEINALKLFKIKYPKELSVSQS